MFSELVKDLLRGRPRNEVGAREQGNIWTQQIKRIPGGEPEGEEEKPSKLAQSWREVHWVIFPLTVLGTPNLPPCSHWCILKNGSLMRRVSISSQPPRKHINHLLQPRSLSPINRNHQLDHHISEENWYQEGQRHDLQMGSHSRRCGAIKSNSET